MKKILVILENLAISLIEFIESSTSDDVEEFLEKKAVSRIVMILGIALLAVLIYDSFTNHSNVQLIQYLTMKN